MRHRKVLFPMSAILAASLIIGPLAYAMKPKTHAFSIRGSGGQFILSSVTCDSGTCSHYSGSKSNLNIPGIGRVATFNFDLTRGPTVSTLPDGGDCADFDGTGKITVGSSELD